MGEWRSGVARDTRGEWCWEVYATENSESETNHTGTLLSLAESSCWFLVAGWLLLCKARRSNTTSATGSRDGWMTGWLHRAL